MAAFDTYVGSYGHPIALQGRLAGAADSWSAAALTATVRKGLHGPEADISSTFVVTSQSTAEFTWTADDDTVIDESGAWIMRVHVSDGAAVYDLDDITILVGPPLGTPTPGSSTVLGTGAAINAALLAGSAIGTSAAPYTVALGYASGAAITYEIETPILMQPNTRLHIHEGATLTATYAPVVGLADDSTNYLIGAVPTTSGTTTVATTAPQNSASVVMAAVPTGLTPGRWFTVHGNNTTLGGGPPIQSNADSDGASVVVYTLCQSLSTWNGVSTTVTLAKPLAKHCGAGQTVTAITAPMTNVHITGAGTLDCSGGSIAVGILLRATSGCSVSGGLHFKGFSKAAIVLDHGTDTFDVDTPRGIGELNCLVYGDSCNDGLIRHPWTDPYAASRYHANGNPRHAIMLRNRPARVKVFDADISKMCGGICYVGEGVTVDGLRCADLDPTALLVAGQASGEWSGSTINYCGVVMQGTLTPLAFVENAQGCELHNVTTGQNIITPAGTIGASVIEIVNHYGFLGSNISIVNRGSYTATQSSRGIRWCDSTGSVVGFSIRGVNEPICTRGAPGLFTMSDGYVYAVPGAGSGGVIALSLNHGLTVGAALDNVRFQGYGLATTTITYGADFADYAFELRNCWFDGAGLQPIGRCIVGTNNSGLALDTGYLLQATGSTAGTRQFTRPTGTPAGRVYAAALHPASSGTVFVLAQDLTQSAYVLCVTAEAVAHGDLLRSGTNLFTASNADQTWPGTVMPIGRAVGSKAALAAGLLNTVGI